MSKHYDGGPVHPSLPEHGFNQGEPGMTLRDYFAAKAMQAWVSDPSFLGTEDHIDRAVSISYRISDAMIEEREK